MSTALAPIRCAITIRSKGTDASAGPHLLRPHRFELAVVARELLQLPGPVAVDAAVAGPHAGAMATGIGLPGLRAP